jgi:hypothetical protein
MSEGHTTTNHDTIRKWAEARDGKPARVKGTEDRSGEGILRFDFAEPDEKLEKISWEDFFETFEDRNLALVYQDKTADGKMSRFAKFVRRES